MVESAPRFALLRTGETGLVANTAECLGYKEGGNGRLCQLQQREKVSKTQIGFPSWTRFELSRGARRRPLDRPSTRFNSLRLEHVRGDSDPYGSLFLCLWSHE